MPEKKQAKSIKNVDLAAGFFSDSSTSRTNRQGAFSADVPIQPEKKEGSASTMVINKGGRPKKEGLKNQQYTLTMSPELYEKIRIVENEKRFPSFSQLISTAVKYYCKEKEKIDLDEMELPKETLQRLKDRQSSKKN